MTIVIVSAAIIACYALIQVFLICGIFTRRHELPKSEELKFSVIIAARDEQEYIESCLYSLLNQEVVPEKIILVDDHSTDETVQRARAIASLNSNVEIMCCNDSETGKRAAWLKGITQASTDIVLTIDADCIAGPAWTKALLTHIATSKRMISGPVLPIQKKKCLGSAEYTENLFLVAGGAGTASLGKSFQASGANMAFHRADFIDFFASARGAEFGCGDDVFFLQFLLARYRQKSIGFAQEPDSVVLTKSSDTLREWISQRVRWARKAKGYTNAFSFAVGSLILLVNIGFVITFYYALTHSEVQVLAITALGVKMIADFLLLTASSIRWGLQIKAISFFLLPIWYPAFIVMVAFGALFSGKQSWKGRAIK